MQAEEPEPRHQGQHVMLLIAQQVALLLVLEAPGVPVAQQEALQVPLRS